MLFEFLNNFSNWFLRRAFERIFLDYESFFGLFECLLVFEDFGDFGGLGRAGFQLALLLLHKLPSLEIDFVLLGFGGFFQFVGAHFFWGGFLRFGWGQRLFKVYRDVRN